MRQIFLFLIIFIAGLGYSLPSPAQESPETERPTEKPSTEKVKLRSWLKEFRQKENLAILFGNVRVSKGKFNLLADAVVVWFDEKKLDASEIYAEGAILLTDGKDIISAEAVYYNFNTGKARIIRAWVQTTQKALASLSPSGQSKESGPAPPKPEPEIGLYLRAEKLRTERPTRYVAEDLTLSTCEFPQPHWGIRYREAVVYPSGTFEASGNQLFIGAVKIPFFNVRFEPDWRMPLYSLNFGSSADKGNFTLSRWQLVIEQSYKFFCDLDSYHKTGLGRGALFEYKGRVTPWSGFLQYYTIDDRDPPLTAKPYRYRMKFLHVQNLPGDIGLALEYSKTTDPGFLSQFFEREYKKGREQETYAYARKTHRNMGFRLLASLRTEKFKTVTQHHPQFLSDLISQEIPGGFYLTAALRSEKLHRDYAEPLSLPDEEVERHDMLFSIDRPFSAGRFFRLKPGLDARYTHYNINLFDSQNVDREVVTARCSIDTQLSRIYRAENNWLDINGLKHVIEPMVEYENTYHNDTAPYNLIQFDEVDSIRKEETFTLSLTNRFDTCRKTGEKNSIVNLLDWRLQTRYYPKPTRDNGGEILGPLESRLELSLTPYLTLRSDIAYDMHRRYVGKGAFNATVRKPDKWELYLGSLYVSGEDTIGTAGFSARLSAKWSASVRLQHNLTAGRYVSKTFALTRKFHCWIMEMGVEIERDKNSPTYTFMISPAALFKKDKLRFTEESTFLK